MVLRQRQEPSENIKLEEKESCVLSQNETCLENFQAGVFSLPFPTDF